MDQALIKIHINNCGVYVRANSQIIYVGNSELAIVCSIIAQDSDKYAGKSDRPSFFYF